MEKFFIKKNATSSLNPWLAIIGLNSTQHGFASLYDGLCRTCTIISFDSVDQARRFIEQRPDVCDDRNVIYQMHANGDKIEMIPV